MKKGKHKYSSDSHLSVSELSRYSSKDLRRLDHLRFVVNRRHETLAVLIPYDQYCEIQGEINRLTKEVGGFAMDANLFQDVR